jgi:hypothetical protein
MRQNKYRTEEGVPVRENKPRDSNLVVGIRST